MNEIPILGDDPKKWVLALAALLLSMMVGRFVNAWRDGAGIRDAIMSIWLGTNKPKEKQ